MHKAKNISLIATLILILLLGGCWYFYFIKAPNNLAVKKGVFKFPDKYEIYTSIKCSFFDIANPEYSFINKKPDRDLEIMFYKIKDSQKISKNIDFDYIGGTDIKNTTFPELVKMVKKDCSQFQKAKGDPSDKTINWSYSPYIPEPPKEPEPEITEEEAAARRQRAIDQYNMIKELREKGE